MEKSYLVELNIYIQAFYGLQKILLDNFPRNFYIWSAMIVNGTRMQKIKIGHRVKFRAKNKCFPQILFPVRAIAFNFQCADFDSFS